MLQPEDREEFLLCFWDFRVQLLAFLNLKICDNVFVIVVVYAFLLNAKKQLGCLFLS
jgi:hypothetical protein